jgi:hypothetical protein
MKLRLRHAKDLTRERKRWKNNNALREYAVGMQRAIKAIEEAHKEGKNDTDIYPPLSESVLEELRRNGYRVKRVPPGEFAAMGTSESVKIEWD